MTNPCKQDQWRVLAATFAVFINLKAVHWIEVCAVIDTSVARFLSFVIIFIKKSDNNILNLKKKKWFIRLNGVLWEWSWNTVVLWSSTSPHCHPEVSLLSHCRSDANLQLSRPAEKTVTCCRQHSSLCRGFKSSTPQRRCDQHHELETQLVG